MNEDDKLIEKIINNYGKGYKELDRRKLLISIKCIIKYFFSFVFGSKEVKIQQRNFKLHLPKELDSEFKNLFSISSNPSIKKEHTVSFFKIYYYLCLSCIFRKNSLGVFFFKLAYKKLNYKLSGDAIQVVNAGPSFFTHLFSYYCYKNDGSNFYFIQHAVYQLDYEPYVFEQKFDKGLTLLLWSEMLLQNLAKICKCKMLVVPTYKFTKISEFNEMDTAKTSKKVIVFIGESINKLNKDYDKLYLQEMLKVRDCFKMQFDNCEFYFKPHPRMLNKKQFCDALSNEYNIKIINSLNNSKVDFAVAHISTFLLETLSKGIRCFQMNIKVDNMKTTDYTLLSSVISTDLLMSNKFNVSTDFPKNYIDKDYLYIKEQYLRDYKNVLL
ncbi:hypothetical protein L1S35_09375 [Flavobacterium sp. AS60]|uniref:hypothetical protein n=1 Tax=Flavobacterium anseongense TaxID=2910677 RepID=UPI001F24321B|nr:hypothetical protein [Flavobacterium sp. AS60]MCF6129885.1 hypothetical protein [Flavobacterium sp. AS60]